MKSQRQKDTQGKKDYYYINRAGTISSKLFDNTPKDWKRWEQNNYYETISEALKYVNKV